MILRFPELVDHMQYTAHQIEVEGSDNLIGDGACDGKGMGCTTIINSFVEAVKMFEESVRIFLS